VRLPSAIAHSATGLRTATLQVATNAASPTTVGLTGTGTTPVATLSNDSLIFGNQNVGTTSADQAVTLSNSGTGALLISSLSVTGVNGADFGQTNTCGASVAPGSSCTISVTFVPTNRGTRTAAVSIADNGWVGTWAASPQPASSPLPINGRPCVKSCTRASAGTSGAYDAVIDFDGVLRDPVHPTRLRPEYDSGDHLHPNDLGHRAIADAINLKLFRPEED
jgi:hypothetical protein